MIYDGDGLTFTEKRIADARDKLWEDIQESIDQYIQSDIFQQFSDSTQDLLHDILPADCPREIAVAAVIKILENIKSDISPYKIKESE